MPLKPARLFRLALAASLTVSALLFFVFTWRWPLVGDASLIHYIAFLIERGWAPYRQLGDMNMPGSFLIELAAMHLFGTGDLAWRLFDFTLLIAASGAFVVIIRNPGRINTNPGEIARSPGGIRNLGAPFVTASPSRVGFLRPSLPAIFSACLFILIHGRDGLAEGGQRDLTMADCLLGATAFLFLAVRKRSINAAILFGFFSGITLTIKPTALPLTLLQLFLAAYALRKSQELLSDPAPSIKTQLILPALLALCIGPAIALAFLLREQALAAFLAGFHGILPYYASLGHRPISFVLLHSISPLLPLVVVWLLVLALRNRQTPWRADWERNALLAGVLFGLINCLVQQRALPYYRYPLLAFLLPLIALDLVQAFGPAHDPDAPFVPALRSRVGHKPSWSSRLSSILATLALAYAAFILAPQSAVLIHRYQWNNTDFITSLEQNLNSLGDPSLSGHVQCIDSISGCGNVLYRLRLEPATGVLSDFLLFGSVSDTRPPDQIPILRDTRSQFAADIVAHPPQVIIVTSHLHIDGPDDFEKLARWPAFADFLRTRYTLRTQWSPTRTARWWSREETPASYRIYVLRSPSGAP